MQSLGSVYSAKLKGRAVCETEEEEEEPNPEVSDSGTDTSVQLGQASIAYHIMFWVIHWTSYESWLGIGLTLYF